MVYNPSLISSDQLPTSIMDLQKPEWKGRWAASPTGADFQAIVSAILQEKGEDATTAWLTAMKENASAYKGNSTVMKAVNAGEIPLGVIYHYYWFIDQAKTKENSANTKLAYFGPRTRGVRQRVGRRRARLEQERRRRAAVPRLHHRPGRTAGPARRHELRVCDRQRRRLQPGPAAAELSAAAGDRPSTLNSKKVTDLMTAAGLI
jgi:iron(III) transport system substrate-binding protein